MCTTKTDKQKLNTGEVNTWSGGKNDNHEAVIASIIEKQTNALLLWKPINERHLYVRMNLKHFKLSNW
jgi:hypothetical protein